MEPLLMMEPNMKLKRSAVSGIAGDDMMMMDTVTALSKKSYSEWVPQTRYSSAIVLNEY
jgi:hypothetical protein